jgi:hypothetical protein
MRWVEALVAAALAFGGFRSLVHWLLKPFAGRDRLDHLLFALFVLGRVGLWWSLSGLFAIYAVLSGHLRGQAFTDEVRARLWWYPTITICLAALQMVSGLFLGRRKEAVNDQ